MKRLALAAAFLCWTGGLTLGTAQVQVEQPGLRGRVNVTFHERSDEGQAERLRDLAIRVKPMADRLFELDQIDIVVVHSQRELDQRLGPQQAGAQAGVSYVHGILFLSPLSWRRNPTEEALEHEMKEAVVRYTAVRLVGGNHMPYWLEDGLVSLFTDRTFAPATAQVVARRAPLLLTEFGPADPPVGYWAVRYLLDARGGVVRLQQLLRLLAQRPDTFVDNLQLVYGVSVGELERDWRQWLEEFAKADRIRREGGVREGPLVRDRDQNRD